MKLGFGGRDVCGGVVEVSTQQGKLSSLPHKHSCLFNAGLGKVCV